MPTPNRPRPPTRPATATRSTVRVPGCLPPRITPGRPTASPRRATFASIAAPAPDDEGRESIAGALREFFDEQAKLVQARLKRLAAIPDDLTLTDWDDPMASAMTPVLRGIWSDGGRATMGELGLDPDEWRVTDPHIAEAIDQTALDFCKATNESTSLELNVALAKLREELKLGLITQGESLEQLKKRVQGVFDKASDLRADRIAESEASRAVHAASMISAAQSGVVKGTRWLASEDACPECLQLAKVTAKRPVPLGEIYATIGSNPTYKDIRHPPSHPGCNCTMLLVLDDEPDDESSAL